jgi:hypothetical protein
MLVHVVLFWLRDDLSTEDQAHFVQGLKSLQKIDAAESVFVGTPAATPDRPVIDSSYDYCLTVILRDMAAHDAYQADPLHQSFLDSFRSFWKQVKVYDAD